jgi:hypothetical protein
MRAQMLSMFDDDGSLLFTHANGRTTGILLSEEQINSWVTHRTGKRKKADRDINGGEDAVERGQQQLIDSILAVNEESDDNIED